MISPKLINTFGIIKAHLDRKRAGGARAGSKIRTMSLYSARSDRTRSCARLLSECPLYKLIVLIMVPARSPPARLLSEWALRQKSSKEK